VAGSLLDEESNQLATNIVKVCGPRMDAPPMQLALKDVRLSVLPN